jgi:hypothetical protein
MAQETVGCLQNVPRAYTGRPGVPIPPPPISNSFFHHLQYLVAGPLRGYYPVVSPAPRRARPRPPAGPQSAVERASASARRAPARLDPPPPRRRGVDGRGPHLQGRRRGGQRGRRAPRRNRHPQSVMAQAGGTTLRCWRPTSRERPGGYCCGVCTNNSVSSCSILLTQDCGAVWDPTHLFRWRCGGGQHLFGAVASTAGPTLAAGAR